MAGKRHRKTGELWNRIRDFVAMFQQRNGYGPSLREVQLEVDLSSPSNAKYHVDKMLDEGWLTGIAGRARTLNVPNFLSNGLSELRQRLPEVSFVKVPRLGTIHAGATVEVQDVPLPGQTDEFDWLDVPEYLVGRADKAFELEVNGDSMIDALVNDGDSVIFEVTHRAQRGDMVAARINRDGAYETTLKRYYPRDPEPGMVRLQPENPSFEPIYVDAKDLRIEGKAIAVLRQYYPAHQRDWSPAPAGNARRRVAELPAPNREVAVVETSESA